MLKKNIFELKQMLRSKARRFQKQVMKEQYLSLDELHHLNWQRRLRLLERAALAPYYEKKFKEVGCELGDIKTEEDFNRLPVLTRKDVQDNMDALIPRDVNKKHLSITSTGGSTGEPLKLWRPKNLPYDAFTMRMLSWWDIAPHENSAYIFRREYRGRAKVANDIKWWPTKRIFLNASRMTEANCFAFYKHLLLIKPALLVGYVGAISQFTDFLENANLQLPFDLKAVWTTAAPLPECLRLKIQNILDAPVYSQYGSCEFGHIAAECEKQCGMHAYIDWRHIEVVDENFVPCSLGAEGQLLVTDMLAEDAPLIRYALGDQGRWSLKPCQCGCNLPLLDTVKGRISEYFMLPDGGKVPGEYLTTIFDATPDLVRNFQVRQASDGSVTVHYVPRITNDLGIKEVKTYLETLLRHQVPVTFQAHSEIPHAAGKTKFIISEIENGQRQ